MTYGRRRLKWCIAISYRRRTRLAKPDSPPHSRAPYNRAVAKLHLAGRSAILSQDTTAEVERTQIDAWRRMSPLEKVELLAQATRDALTLALAGIRQRHPTASDRECFLRLAELQLGATLVRTVYPDASQVLGPRA